MQTIRIAPAHPATQGHQTLFFGAGMAGADTAWDGAASRRAAGCNPLSSSITVSPVAPWSIVAASSSDDRRWTVDGGRSAVCRLPSALCTQHCLDFGSLLGRGIG
ncbi:MAG: hypothetical protein ACK4VW_04495 [Anaerolineales bacterium]